MFVSPNVLANIPPNIPIILTPHVEDDFVNTSRAAFRTGPFADIDGTNSHLATDWEIVSTNPVEVVWAAYGQTGAARTYVALSNGAFQGVHSGRTDLPLNQSFHLRVRHRDDSGDVATEWGGWGERRFHTFTPTVLVGPRAPWNYLDDGSDQGTNWVSRDFDDSTWKAGLGQFGYGDFPVTTNAYGPDTTNKYITTYFRTAFDVADITALGALKMLFVRDDGLVVHVNGAEIFRNNMPTGSVHFRTLAASDITGAVEANLHEFSVPAGVLVNGRNVIAAEVHQASSTSSDMSFYLEVRGSRRGQGPVNIVAFSDFEVDGDGWDVVFTENNSQTNFSYRGWQSIGGNPAGMWRYLDDGDGQTHLFNAPAKFLGNRLDTYGGFIEFDFRLSSHGRSRYVVRLHSGNNVLGAPAAYIRGENWTTFRIGLEENAGWRRSTNQFNSDLGPASRNDLLTVLSNLTAVRIHGEGYEAQDNARIDNVRLVASPCDEPAGLSISALSNNLVAIQWPSNRTCLRLESSPSLNVPSWSTNMPGTETTSANGLRSRIIEATGTAFFRLQRE